MTDKHIIIYKKECYNEPYCSLNQVLEQLKAKEQECEELKNIIDEAKNSKLDLKSFLVGEAVQNEYEQQLDQLKADRKEALKQLEFVRTLNTVKEAETRKLHKTLTEIKEIAENAYCLTNSTNKDMAQFAKQILQKISECEGKDEM